jgi:hypothetical protein
MCKLCDEGKPQDHSGPVRDSRRDFLKASTATAIAAAGVNFLSAPPAAAQAKDDPPGDSGKPGRRYIIRGGSVMSMDRRTDRGQEDPCGRAESAGGRCHADRRQRPHRHAGFY